MRKNEHKKQIRVLNFSSFAVENVSIAAFLRLLTPFEVDEDIHFFSSYWKYYGS
tara:strand:- start:176 stop:337 length:162 start_codon:yes stop_codon:yes gene_type:complete